MCAAASIVIGAVAPLRRAAAVALSKVVITAASPFAPDIRGFHALPTTSKILAVDGSDLGDLSGAPRRDPVGLDRLPPHVAHAVLAAEDASFYQDAGIDPIGIARAAINDARGRRTEGGSTIDQQLAKLNYTGSRHSILRKAAEILYVAKLEDRYTKGQLLERYLNQVYFGDGAYGIAAAAQSHFGLPPEQLTPAQAATLAGKIRAPEALDPRRRPAAVVVRRNQVLRAMRSHGWLTTAEHRAALATPLVVTPPPPTTTRAPHFVQYVAREAATLDVLGSTPEERTNQLFTGGYTVHTTLDPKAYDAAAAAVTSRLSGPADPATAVVSVQPGDGAIRDLFGGLNFDQHQFDPASEGLRQAGSSFKVFDYLAMLGHGIDPRSVLPAPPQTTVSCPDGQQYLVRNYEGESPGRASVDQALAQSVNTVFAEIVAKVGPAEVIRAAVAAGIPPRNAANCAVALGGLSRGVSPLEMAAAYATFAAKGVYAQPYAIASIRGRDGNVIYNHSVKTREAFDPRQVGILTAALTGVVTHGTGTAADIGRPVAGKTGTTEGYGDAWFVGYVPQLATAVWVGYLDGSRPMTNIHGLAVTGGTFPVPVASPPGLALNPFDALRRSSGALGTVGPTMTTASAGTTLPAAPGSGGGAGTGGPAPGGSAADTTVPFATATTSPPGPTTTTPPASTTTAPPRRTTTTTTAPPSSTTTTALA